MHWDRLDNYVVADDMLEISREIANRVTTDGGKIVQEASGRLGVDLPDIIRRNSKGDVNCYPGLPGGCHPVAYFIYVQGPLRGNERWPFNF